MALRPARQEIFEDSKGHFSHACHHISVRGTQKNARSGIMFGSWDERGLFCRFKSSIAISSAELGTLWNS
ncbi:hypothetical protein VTN31DRAFT_3539 [Thermomyces dupontii]|uniref:uncharacterized protein n=1 Tax=Talaromyces thermophilus TaxID=28565 RepID=UPI0037435557